MNVALFFFSYNGNKKQKDIIMKLYELRNGESARVRDIYAEGKLKTRLNDIGMYEGCTVKRVKESPLGDPIAYFICDSIFALRKRDAGLIEVERIGNEA